MYAKCGMLQEAEDVFYSLPSRTVVSWTILMAGYTENGHAEEAFQCFEQMQSDGVQPNRVTYLCILHACAHLRAVDKCQEMHFKIVQDNLENDRIIGTALVNTYAKCGLLEKAQEAFDRISVRNVVSFGALLSALVQHDRVEEVLEHFELMQQEGIQPNAAIFIYVCKACSSMRALSKGRRVHLEIMKLGTVDKNIMVANAMLDMYAKCSALIDAQCVFDNLNSRSVVSWNVLIMGYIHYGNDIENAFLLLADMQQDDFSPDAVTFIAILKACSSLKAVNKGQQMHSDVLKLGFLEENVGIGVALVEMYCKCGLLADAQSVFNEVPVKSVILWNVLISGYIQHGYNEEALECFNEMQIKGFSPDVVTLTSILKACSVLRAVDKGQEIHSQLDKEGLCDVMAATALIDMYSKCGLVEKAQQVFDNLLARDTVSWTALIVGYAEEGLGEEALECYQQMQLEDISPNAVTFIGLLKACGSIGAAIKGREVHDEIVNYASLEKDIIVGTSLVDMYGKCGLVSQAIEVFWELPSHTVVSWNALIAGYCQVGEAQHAFEAYNAMLLEGLIPSDVTFTSLFNTCSHAGLLDKCKLYFESMDTNYSILPTVEHYNCIIDIFGRSGQVEKAVAVVQVTPFLSTFTGWHILLAACERYEPATEAFIRLTNMYADFGSEDEVICHIT
ncbi:hypothetical protein KP509_06G072700 [Ceratopteris richardii]|nr:hypothetical protein KP509_06G072700 [Ceratopteris richardii]